MTPRRTTSRQSIPFLRRRRHKQVAVISTCVVGIVLGVFGLSWVTHWDSFKITTVEVYGAHTDLAPTIRTRATDFIAGAYLGLFSRSHMWMYPENALALTILGLSSDISSVESHVQDRHTLVVSIIEKTPSAVVCSGLPDFDGEELGQSFAGACYFVDREGVLFGIAPSFSGGVYRRYYIDEEFKIGQHILPDIFDTLQSFYDAVRVADIDAQAILVKADHEYELYIRDARDTDAPHMTIVYFNTTRDIVEQKDNFLAFWLHMVKEDRIKRVLTLFDSIDIRFGSNVFYRITSP